MYHPKTVLDCRYGHPATDTVYHTLCVIATYQLSNRVQVLHEIGDRVSLCGEGGEGVAKRKGKVERGGGREEKGRVVNL